MAERRMFAKTIVLSDAFLDMPLSARCLYFTLGMMADDDGFVGSPKAIMRQCGASQDDLVVLLQKRFVLGFESGVIVIKHWRMNNYLQNDRKKDTTYLEELAALDIDKNGAYTERDKAVYTNCIQNVYTGKDSIDKDSIGKLSVDEGSVSTKSSLHSSKGVYGEYKNVFLTDNEYDSLKSEYVDYINKIEKLSSYMESTGRKYNNHYATIRSWAKEDDTDIKKSYKNKAAVELDAYYDMTANFAKEED